jgi:hypothetical protein
VWTALTGTRWQMDPLQLALDTSLVIIFRNIFVCHLARLPEAVQAMIGILAAAVEVNNLHQNVLLCVRTPRNFASCMCAWLGPAPRRFVRGRVCNNFSVTTYAPVTQQAATKGLESSACGLGRHESCL